MLYQQCAKKKTNIVNIIIYERLKKEDKKIEKFNKKNDFKVNYSFSKMVFF